MNYKSEWVCETTKGVILKGVVLKGLILRGIIFSRIALWRVTLRGITLRGVALRALLLNKLLLLAVLVSCGEESPRAKPQQITVFANPIVGTAALGLVSNARVDAYLIATESQAQQHKECSTDNKNKIGSGTTDDNGYFNLTLNLDSGYVLFVLSGGSYIEEATNQKVYLTNNQKLYATHHYHSGEIKEQADIVISPWSHLMAGMFCYMMGSHTMSPAISPANSMINTSNFITNWLGFDPRYVNYKDPTDDKNNRADLIFDEGVKLGFLNSAISELTKEWSVTDEATTHATINSIYLAQLMYEDINNDGVLDGRGAKGPLHIVRKVSNIPLNAATYRLSIPQQMLHFFDNNDNNQIKDNGRGILYLLADGINSNEHPQVFQQQSPPLDMLAPQVEWLAPNTKRLTGVVNISLRVKDFSGVEQVTFYAASSRAASQNREQAIDDIYTFIVDTRPDGSGDFDYRVTTMDILGNQQTINFPVTLINEAPIIEIIAPDINNRDNNAGTTATTNESAYLLEARFSKIVPSQSIADAACSLNDEQNFDVVINKEESIASCAVLLPHNGIHHIEMKLCDDNNLCNTRGHNVLFDNQPPVITPINEQESYYRNVSVSFMISDTTSNIIQPVTWIASGNGETMNGVAQQLPTEGIYQVLFDAARFGNNPVRLTINSHDSLRNMATRSQTYQVFNQPPTILLVSTTKFKQNSYNAIFEVEENSYTNIRVACRLATSVSFQSGNYQTTQSGNQQSEQTLKPHGKCTTASQEIQDGNHTLEIRICGDYNLCVTQPITITKDTAAPMIKTINLQDEYDGAGGQIILEITDEFSMVTSATFSIDDSEVQDITKRASDWTFALPLNLNTGKHQLTIVAMDALGNTNTIQRDFLTLREEPIISRTSSLYTNSNPYHLAAQLQPGSYQGGYQVQCIVAEQSVVASILRNRINCSLDTSGLNDGEYQVEIILATDYDKSYTREISFIKDTTPPQINILDLLATYTSPVPSTLQVNINDEFSPTVRGVYRINEGDDMQLADTGTRTGESRIIILPINELPTGRHTLTIQATDFVGNPNTMTRNFIVEKDAPIVTQTSAQATNQGTYNLVATLDKGSYQGDYNAECQINNQVVSATISGNNLKCLLDISSSSDNNYDIQVMLTADYGKSYTRTLAVTKDTTAPMIRTINLQDEYDGAGGQIILEITDEFSMVTSATFTINDNEAQDITKRTSDWTFALPLNLNTGRHQLTIVTVDALGNTNTIQRDFLTLREEPIISRTSSLYTDSNLYRLAAQLNSGSYQGTHQAQCILAEQSVVASILRNRINCSLDTQGLNDGEHQVEIILATDYDKSYTREISFIKDTTPPQINILDLLATYTSPVPSTLQVNINDEFSPTVRAVYRINEGDDMQLADTGTRTGESRIIILPINELPTGRHTLTIQATDLVGNSNMMPSNFIVEKDAPIVTQTSAQATNQGAYNLVATLDKGSYQGDYNAECQINNQVVSATISGNNLKCLLDISSSSDNNHDIQVTLTADYDKSYTRTLAVTKDTTAPMVRTINLQDEYDGAGGQIILEITDEFSMVTSATFSIDDNEAQDITKRASDWTFALPLNLNTGKHQLTIVAMDALGNTNTIQRDFLTLREEPIISRTSSLYTNSNPYHLAAQLQPGSYQGGYQVQCIVAEQSVVASILRNRINCSLDTSGLNDGEYQVEIILATDYDKSYTREISFIKDTTPPQINILDLLATYTSPVPSTLQVNINDEFSPTVRGVYRINEGDDMQLADTGTRTGESRIIILPINELPTGRHTLTIQATDFVGNPNTMTRNFIVEKDAPIVTQTSAHATNQGIYNLVATLDKGSYQGDYNAECQLNDQVASAIINGNTLKCLLDISSSSDNNHDIRVTLTADYGKSYTRTLTITKDTTPPQINILDLLATYTSPVPSALQVDINDEFSPTVRAVYRINEGDVMQLTDAGTRTEESIIIILPINELPTGRHTLTIQATDFVGNPNTMTRNFIVEKDALIVTQTSAHATNQGIYNLVATLDKGSYQGDYNAECLLNDQVASAIINGNTLKCLLDISSSSDDSHDIRVTLTADYGKSYTRTLAVTKDTAPPQIVAIEHQQAYSAKPFALRYQVNDPLSNVASVTYLYGDNTQGLSARPIGNNLWEADINPNLLLSGEHNVRVIASDALSNSLQINSPILIIKHPPQVTLTHQNISNQDTLDISGKIILTSPEASVASITCSFLRNPTGAVHREINGEINGNNFVCRSLPIVGLNNELVEVEICDIFANCAIYPTFVTHDNSPPILSSVAMPNMVNVYSCGEKNRYDDIPPNCLITQSPAANIYSISEQAQDLQKTNPPLIVVQQEETLLNNESLVIDSFADVMPNNGLMVSEINRAELDRQGIIFAGINVHDNELSPSRYFTDPYDLNITYSYTQIDCPTDDTGNQNLVCSQNNKKVYFTRKSMPEAAINVNTDSSDAEITIPFSNEFLSSANNPLWYSAPPRIIHRLDIFVCDEAGNCVEYVTRFRVTVLAAAPTVAFNSNNNFRNDFQRHDNLRYLFSVIQRNVRTWRISNPSPTDIWVRVEQSPANIQYFAEMWIMRKINKYSTHRHRQFPRKVGLCGNWPFHRSRYRSVTEYTTDTENYYSSTPNPRGLRFASPHSSTSALKCGSRGTSIDEVRYQQISGYPRQKFIRASSSDKRINFAVTLNRHLVNLAKGTKTPALEYNGWMLLPAGNSLLLTTDEKMTNDPGYYQPIMIYDAPRYIDRYRSVTIPASIGLSYTRSHVDSVSPSLSSVRSRIYQIPQVTVNNRRAIHCARIGSAPAC